MHVHSYTLRHLHPQPHCDSTHSYTHMSTDSWTVTPCTLTALHSPTDPHGDTLITGTRTLTHLQRKLLSGSPQHHDFPPQPISLPDLSFHSSRARAGRALAGLPRPRPGQHVCGARGPQPVPGVRHAGLQAQGEVGGGRCGPTPPPIAGP